jgi:hypothetical protein
MVVHIFGVITHILNVGHVLQGHILHHIAKVIAVEYGMMPALIVQRVRAVIGGATIVILVQKAHIIQLLVAHA